MCIDLDIWCRQPNLVVKYSICLHESSGFLRCWQWECFRLSSGAASACCFCCAFCTTGQVQSSEIASGCMRSDKVSHFNVCYGFAFYSFSLVTEETT